MWLLVSLVISSVVTGGLVCWRYKHVCKSKNHIKLKEYRQTRKTKDNDKIHDTLICVSETQSKEKAVNFSDTSIHEHNYDQILIEEIDETLCNLKQDDDTKILLPVMEESDEEGEVVNHGRNNIQYFSI